MNSSELALATPVASSEWKELASRESNGLVVTLLWSKACNEVKVDVADVRSDEDFELKVDGAEALAAFYHPFAYPGCRRVDAGAPVRESLDLQPQS
jgi:hypothetical protein